MTGFKDCLFISGGGGVSWVGYTGCSDFKGGVEREETQ